VGHAGEALIEYREADILPDRFYLRTYSREICVTRAVSIATAAVVIMSYPVIVTPV
jgi:hypothetical protein